MNQILEHFSFAHPWWLILLIPLSGLFFLRQRPGTHHYVTFSSLSFLANLGHSNKNQPGRLNLFLLVLALWAATFALARPQWTNAYESRSSSGIDMVIALDISESMRIDDFKPEASFRRERRIDVAKRVIDSFIDGRPNDRTGLVVFAGQPYSLSPITMHHEWLLLNLKQVTLGAVTEQGTAIGSAIAAAATRLKERDSKSKIIVLVTDGASNSGPLTPEVAAELAGKIGIKIYAIAMGSIGGRLHSQASPQQEFDETSLRNIAEITEGEFYHAKDNESMRNIFKTIDRLEKSEAQTSTVIDTKELYQWPLLGASLLALLAFSLQLFIPKPMPA